MPSEAPRAAVLVILCAICASIYFHPRPRNAEQPAPQSSDAPASRPEINPGANVDNAVKRAGQHARMAQLSWNRDPFSEAGAPGGSGMTLSGILWDPNNPMAIINGDMVGVDGTVDGFRVTAIASDRVSLSDGRITMTLELNP